MLFAAVCPSIYMQVQKKGQERCLSPLKHIQRGALLRAMFNGKICTHGFWGHSQSAGWACCLAMPAHIHTFLFRGAGSSKRRVSGSVSNPSSARGELKTSFEYLGLASECGGDGVEMPLPPLQCPLVVLLPPSDISPLSFQTSQAACDT